MPTERRQTKIRNTVLILCLALFFDYTATGNAVRGGATQQTIYAINTQQKEMNDNRDALDFGTMNVPRLFVKLFVPTLMGLIFSALLNLADGIFVGRGVGSDALAAINVAAPIFLISTGIALLFATGVSIVAAVHLAQGKTKAACINVTQAFMASGFILVLFSLTIYAAPSTLCYLFGGSTRLEPLVVAYLQGVAPVPVLTSVMFVGMFVIRLDGSPRYAMMCNVLPSLINIALDWLFVFPLHMGIAGAAIATSLSEALAVVGVVIYMTCWSRTIHWHAPRLSATSMRLTLRNVGYMARLGLSTFIGETAIVCMLVVGNYMFIRYLHEDGVAAYSVACYLFPLVFMFGNSIAQASLPIVSYNYGQHNEPRIRSIFRLTAGLAVVLGLAITIFCMAESDVLISLFLQEGSKAYAIGCEGFPYFTLGFLFFTVNIVLIGFYQSIEQTQRATLWMLLRGVILVIPCFVLLPSMIGHQGLWLAVPLSESLTTAVILLCLLHDRLRRPRA